jgi:hypothetical protein
MKVYRSFTCNPTELIPVRTPHRPRPSGSRAPTAATAPDCIAAGSKRSVVNVSV